MIRFFQSREDLYPFYCRSMIGAEIGVLKGDNAKAILDSGCLELHMCDPYKHYEEGPYTLDPANARSQGGHDWLFGALLERFKAETQSGRAHIHRLPSLAAAKLFGDASLDFIYLDSAHDYHNVMADLIAWEPVINETGFMLLHDVTTCPESRKMGFDVVGAMSDFCEDHKWKIVAMSLEGWNTAVITRK
jgi:hypothetical protein